MIFRPTAVKTGVPSGALEKVLFFGAKGVNVLEKAHFLSERWWSGTPVLSRWLAEPDGWGPCVLGGL